MSTGISGSKMVLISEMMVSSLGRCGAGGGTSPSGVQAPWRVSAGALFSLTGRFPFLGAVRQRGVQGVPSQGGALHTARKLMDTSERLQALHLVGQRSGAVGAHAAHGQLAELAGEL